MLQLHIVQKEKSKIPVFVATDGSKTHSITPSLPPRVKDKVSGTHTEPS